MFANCVLRVVTYSAEQKYWHNAVSIIKQPIFLKKMAVKNKNINFYFILFYI